MSKVTIQVGKPNIQLWPIDKLVPYPQNVKLHDKAQIAAIAASIKEFSWNQPISVDKDGVIIGGHGRRLAALEIQKSGATIPSWPDTGVVPVWVRDDLTDEQVRALRLVDNRVAEGSIDTEMFRKELATLDFDLKSFFDEKELQFSVADLGSMNLDAFVEDVGAAVSQQETETKQAIEQLNQKSVPVARVFGFKHVKGANQIHIARLMAEIERQTGLKGEDALVAYWTRLSSTVTGDS
jgi:hypothetical protein